MTQAASWNGGEDGLEEGEPRGEGISMDADSLATSSKRVWCQGPEIGLYQ